MAGQSVSQCLFIYLATLLVTPLQPHPRRHKLVIRQYFSNLSLSDNLISLLPPEYLVK